jgi:hypothetical protein
MIERHGLVLLPPCSIRADPPFLRGRIGATLAMPITSAVPSGTAQRPAHCNRAASVASAGVNAARKAYRS